MEDMKYYNLWEMNQDVGLLCMSCNERDEAAVYPDTIAGVIFQRYFCTHCGAIITTVEVPEEHIIEDMNREIEKELGYDYCID